LPEQLAGSEATVEAGRPQQPAGHPVGDLRDEQPDRQDDQSREDVRQECDGSSERVSEHVCDSHGNSLLPAITF